MSKEKQHIDDFLRNSLESHKVKPSRSFWKGIHGRTGLFVNALLWKLGIPAILLSAIIAAFYPQNNDAPPRETQIEAGKSEKAAEKTAVLDFTAEETPQHEVTSESTISYESNTAESSANESVDADSRVQLASKATLQADAELPVKLFSDEETYLNKKLTTLPLLSKAKISVKKKTHRVYLFRNSRKGNGNGTVKKPETKIYLSSGFNFTSLSSDTITELNNYEMGVEASVKISPVLHLQTGLIYNRISDRGYGKWEYTTFDNVGTLNILLAVGGEFMADDTTRYVLQQVPLYDSIHHTITGRIKSKASYFKIPLKLRYNALTLPRMDIEIIGGMTAHLLNEQSYIYEKLEGKYFSPLLPERERIYLTSSAGLAFTYYIRKNTGIWMQPEVNIPIDSPFKWQNKLQDYQFSLRAGIVIKL